MNSSLVPLAAFQMNISLIDLAVIVIYLLGIMAIGILSVRKMKLTGDVYFLAGRALGWPVVGAALFASNISTIHLVGLAQDGYAKGLVVGNFEWMATFTLILLALVFAPFYFRSHITTLPEFLEKRYSPLARSIMAFMAILAALLIHIGISLYAGAEVFEQFFGIDVWLSILIISAVTAIYTVVGGLRAVVVTETIQTVILLGGAVLITCLALAELPKHDVHNWSQFNMKIDVQHSAESLDGAADLLAGADLVYNHRQQLAPLAASFSQVADLLEAGQSAQARSAVIALADRLGSDGLRETVSTVLSVEGAGKVSAVLAIENSADSPSEPNADGKAPDALAQAIEDAKAGGFRAAAKAIKVLQDNPDLVADDILWALGTPISDGEKLAFVAGELDKAGFKELAALVGDMEQWKKSGALGGFKDRLAQAADACRKASAKVTETGDMNKYLASDKPIRTPRLSMLRGAGPFSWLAILLGYPILGVWYWCSDQTIVQRVLGARNQINAQNGALFAGLLKITPAFLMVLPGTIAFIIFRHQIGGDSPKTLPVMITQLMPKGLLGLMAAALMAALMSTIAAALNSVGTLVAKDIVGHFRPQTSDAAQVRIGRISAVVLMLLAMLWSTQGGKFGTIFEIINKIPALFLAPPITTVFVWGVFWKRGTRQAAVATLILGLTVGFILFLADTKPIAGQEWISSARYGLGIPFMLQAFLMFCIWSVFFVIVSLCTPKPDPAQVENTTWPNPLHVIFHGKLKGWYDPRLLTIGLFAVMIVLYYIFR